jgi:hypothetical protein
MTLQNPKETFSAPFALDVIHTEGADRVHSLYQGLENDQTNHKTETRVQKTKLR